MITLKSIRLLSLSILATGFLPAISLAQDGKPDPSQPPTKDTPPTNFDQLDAVKGYGGLAFNSDFSAAKALEIEQDRGPLKIYKKVDRSDAKKTPLALGPALLETVLYYYFEGKLYGVAFHTNDGHDSSNLKAIFTAAFGQGEDSADGEPSTIWLGKKNGALFEMNPLTGEASAFLFDHQLNDAYLKYESEADEKAASLLIKGE